METNQKSIKKEMIIPFINQLFCKIGFYFFMTLSALFLGILAINGFYVINSLSILLFISLIIVYVGLNTIIFYTGIQLYHYTLFRIIFSFFAFVCIVYFFVFYTSISIQVQNFIEHFIMLFK